MPFCKGASRLVQIDLLGVFLTYSLVHIQTIVTFGTSTQDFLRTHGMTEYVCHSVLYFPVFVLSFSEFSSIEVLQMPVQVSQFHFAELAKVKFHACTNENLPRAVIFAIRYWDFFKEKGYLQLGDLLELNEQKVTELKKTVCPD